MFVVYLCLVPVIWRSGPRARVRLCCAKHENRTFFSLVGRLAGLGGPWRSKNHTQTTTGLPYVAVWCVKCVFSAVSKPASPGSTSRRFLSRGRRPIGDRRSTSGDRRSPTGARGLSGAVHRGGAGLWFVILFFSGKSTISPNSKRTPQAVGRGGVVGARASQVFRAGVRRNFAVGRRSGTGPESLY